ncbi:MAG TPA: YceI family protein [Luteibacter sp.]|jgi:polyisoprenoid-binding protein YceI|nr:YceI family protein [Luteibacter sp.]
MPRIGLTVLTLLLATGVARGEPVTYTFVTKLSRVMFTVDHSGFSNPFGIMKLAPGRFVFDGKDWSKSSVTVRLPTRTLDMGDELWNKQIRGDESWEKLFKATDIVFRSTRLERKDETHGTLHGDLTLAGVTRPVALELHLNKIAVNHFSSLPWIGFSATTTISRSQFGLGAYGPYIGDDIPMRIEVEGAVGDPK